MSTTHVASEPAAGPTQTPKPLAQRPALAPSREAKQRAAAILEVLAGGRTPTAAAQALGVSLPRYYLLEERALRGLLTACEPAPRGPHADPERQRQALQAECARWQRECARQQALVRAAQRTIGLAAPAPPPKDGKEQGRQEAAPAQAGGARLASRRAAPAGSRGPGSAGAGHTGELT